MFHITQVHSYCCVLIGKNTNINSLPGISTPPRFVLCSMLLFLHGLSEDPTWIAVRQIDSLKIKMDRIKTLETYAIALNGR